jgi:branched-chain amino acid transport system substrate-binding protein
VVKTRMPRFGAFVAAGIASMTLGAGCGAVLGEEDGGTVVIGVDLALSGGGSTLGEIYQQAIELRVKQVNDQGVLRDNLQLALEPRDNRSESGVSAENLATLARDDSVDAIITAGCAECLTEDVVNTLNQELVPTIALGGSSALIQPVEERRPIFRLGPNAVDNAALLANTMNETDGVSTIGLVNTDDNYGQEGRQQMEVAIGRQGIDLEMPVSETVAAGDDLGGVASSLAGYRSDEGFDEFGQSVEGDPLDAVVIWAPSPLAGEFAVALRAAGYEGSLYLDAVAADDVLLIGEPGSALVDATMVFTETLVIDDVIATSPAKAARKAWVRDYTARYGAYDAASSYAADAVELVVQAVNSLDGGEDVEGAAAEPDRESLLGQIELLNIEGFTGTIQMKPNQHSGLHSQSLTTLVARGERWRPAA